MTTPSVAIDRIDYQNTLLAFFSEYLDLILDDWMELRTALICENFQSDKVPDGTGSATDLDAVDALDDARVAAIDKVIEDDSRGTLRMPIGVSDSRCKRQGEKQD